MYAFNSVVTSQGVFLVSFNNELTENNNHNSCCAAIIYYTNESTISTSTGFRDCIMHEHSLHNSSGQYHVYSYFLARLFDFTCNTQFHWLGTLKSLNRI